jgi:hypothetical protein
MEILQYTMPHCANAFGDTNSIAFAWSDHAKEMWQYAPYSLGTKGMCMRPNFGVRCFNSSFTLCPADEAGKQCSGHGACLDSGVCTCDCGWDGDVDCSKKTSSKEDRNWAIEYGSLPTIRIQTSVGMDDLVGLAKLRILGAASQPLQHLRVAAYLFRCDGTRATNVRYTNRQQEVGYGGTWFDNPPPQYCAVGGPYSHYEYQPVFSRPSAEDGTVKFGHIQFSSAPPGCYKVIHSLSPPPFLLAVGGIHPI